MFKKILKYGIIISKMPSPFSIYPPLPPHPPPPTPPQKKKKTVTIYIYIQPIHINTVITDIYSPSNVYRYNQSVPT